MKQSQMASSRGDLLDANDPALAQGPQQHLGISGEHQQSTPRKVADGIRDVRAGPAQGRQQKGILISKLVNRIGIGQCLVDFVVEYNCMY